MSECSQGICADGAAILRDGQPMTVDEIVAALNHAERERELAVRIYNHGYRAGHHDTVEGVYVDLHRTDMGSYHIDEVDELLSDLATHEHNEGES